MNHVWLIRRAILVVVLVVVLSSTLSGFAHGKEEPVDAGLGSNSLAAGFLGLPWGTQPEKLAGARYITGLAPDLTAYSIDLDVSPLLGTIPVDSSPFLVFSSKSGLVYTRINFDSGDYEAVEKRLTQLLGSRSPIIYELMNTRVDFFDKSEWLLKNNIKVVLVSRVSGASIEIGKRDFWLPGEINFTELVAAAMLEQAEEYDQRDRVLEASSIYQMLLNGTRSYHSYLRTAAEHLAAYSSQQNTVDHLGETSGFVFSRLKNVLSNDNGQLWLRVELSMAARQELLRQRSAAIELNLADIRTVLCRVKLNPAAGKYSVVEQIWLGRSNQIIGGRVAWAPQDYGWPAPIISKACEDFLEAWFTIGGTSGKRTPSR